MLSYSQRKTGKDSRLIGFSALRGRMGKSLGMRGGMGGICRFAASWKRNGHRDGEEDRGMLTNARVRHNPGAVIRSP